MPLSKKSFELLSQMISSSLLEVFQGRSGIGIILDNEEKTDDPEN
jgi:hypothetical protein